MCFSTLFDWRILLAIPEFAAANRQWRQQLVTQSTDKVCAAWVATRRHCQQLLPVPGPFAYFYSVRWNDIFRQFGLNLFGSLVFRPARFGVNPSPSRRRVASLFWVPENISGASKHNLLCSLEHEFPFVKLAIAVPLREKPFFYLATYPVFLRYFILWICDVLHFVFVATCPLFCTGLEK